MSQMGRGAGSRWLTGFVLSVLILSGAPELLARSSHKLPCKKIRDAVWTGQTLDEVAAQFGTDTEHVIRCIQKPGGREAEEDEKVEESQAQQGKAFRPGKSPQR
jgi:hypothetical protein